MPSEPSPTAVQRASRILRRGATRHPAEVKLRLRGGPEAVSLARHSLNDLQSELGPELFEDMRLLVSELVTNSVRHADAPPDALVSVRARVSVDGVRLEVEDDGRTGSIARRVPDLQKGGGFGLNVVERLSARWGVDRDAGTRVWAEIAFAPAG